MAKKGKKKRTPARTEPNTGGRQSAQWIIVAAIIFFFAAGFVVKIVSAPVSNSGLNSVAYSTGSGGSAALESRVKLVAANFKCACGKCGELFLVDCTCDMPRGAKEEKDFIRRKLQEGLPVERVIQLVDEQYGHKIG